MNTPLNAPITPNDLVLRLIGSDRDGQLVNVANEKFLLSGLLPNKEDAEKYRCAIFRGEKGVAFRSYSDLVLCNGAKVAVQWLKEGDLIKLDDQLSIEVYQVGVYKPKAPTSRVRQPAQTMEMSPDSAPKPYRSTPTIDLGPMTNVPTTSAEEPRFKPATDNFRVPAVTAPLESHRVSASSSSTKTSSTNSANAPAVPMTRVPANTYAIDVVPTTTSPDSPAVLDSLITSTTPEPTKEPPQSDSSSLDSLTSRLEKLVDSAGTSGDVEDETISQTESVVDQLASVASPEETSELETPELENSQPETLQPEIPTVAIPPVTPAADTSPTTPDPQPVVNDSASRKSALEDYFSKSGISLSDAQPQSEPNVTPETNMVSETSPAPLVAEAPATPATPETSATPEVVAEASTSSQFDLDSVLSKLGTKPEETSAAVAEPTDAATPTSAEEPAPVPTVVVPPLGETEEQVPTNTFDSSASSGDTPEVDYDQHPHAVEAQPDDKIVADTDSSATGDSEPMQSFELLQSLGLDTSGLSNIKNEISAPPTVAETEATDNGVTSQTEDSSSADAQTEEPAPVAEVESVADVLARMKMAGSLSDLDVSESEPVSQPTETAPATPPPAPARSETPESAGEEEDGSVEDYMSRLLGRMRGDEEPTTTEAPEKSQETAEPAVAHAADATNSETSAPAVDKLTAEEFVPQQKAVRMQSLDSLREIANSNARKAMRDSIAKERKVSTQTKLTLSLTSLLFAVLFFIMSYLVVERVNVWGVVFGIAFLCFGILTSRAYLSERQLDESILSD